MVGVTIDHDKEIISTIGDDCSNGDESMHDVARTVKFQLVSVPEDKFDPNPMPRKFISS